MAIKRVPRPRDPIARAKLIGDIATGHAPDAVDDGKGERAAGGRKGGPARAAKLTKEQREQIARIAADARWKRSDS